MRYTFTAPVPSKLLNNFTDEESLDLTKEDMDAIDASFDTDEYNYFFSTCAPQKELRFE